ncbi:unnamed protein product [Bathycoccus prasinos]
MGIFDASLPRLRKNEHPLFSESSRFYEKPRRRQRQNALLTPSSNTKDEHLLTAAMRKAKRVSSEKNREEEEEEKEKKKRRDKSILAGKTDAKMRLLHADDREDETMSDSDEFYEQNQGAAAAAKKSNVNAKKKEKSEEEMHEELKRTMFVGNVPTKTKAKELVSFFKEMLLSSSSSSSSKSEKKTKKTKAEVVSARIRSVPLKKSADEKDAKVPVRAKILGSLGKRKKDTENSGSINEASKSGCTAYVVWKREKDCERAVKKGNMQKFNGHTLRVDFAVKSSQTTKGGKGDDGSGVTYDRTKSVFIGNLPFDVSDEEVIEIFTKNKEYKELKTELEAVRVVRDKATRTGKGIAFVLFKSVKAARTALLLDGFEMGKRELRVTKVGVVAPKRGNEKDTKNGSHENNNNNANNNKRKINSWEGGRSAKGNKAAKFEKKKSPTASALGDGKGKSAAFVGAKKKRASSSAGGKKRPAVALRKAKMKAGL